MISSVSQTFVFHFLRTLFLALLSILKNGIICFLDVRFSGKAEKGGPLGIINLQSRYPFGGGTKAVMRTHLGKKKAK